METSAEKYQWNDRLQNAPVYEDNGDLEVCPGVLREVVVEDWMDHADSICPFAPSLLWKIRGNHRNYGGDFVYNRVCDHGVHHIFCGKGIKAKFYS